MSGIQNESNEVQVSHEDAAESFNKIDDNTPEPIKEIEGSEPAVTVAAAAVSGPQVSIPDFVHDAADVSVSDHIGFDPAIHRADADGNPILTRGGAYAKRRGPPKKGTTRPAETVFPGDALGGGTVPPPETVSAAIPVQAAAASVSTAQTAVFLVTSVTGVLSRAIGPEWAADKQEIKGLSDAVKNYIDAKGGIAITPEMGLALALSAYAIPRLAVENTQTKLQKAFGWVRDRVDIVRARIARARSGAQ